MKNIKMDQFMVYILRCGDGSLYTGITNDLSRRLSLHSKGKGARYVTSRLPIELVYVEGPFEKKGDALRREYAIKKLRRDQKIALISAHAPHTFKETQV